MDAMRLLMIGRTSIMIAHRLNSLRYCDVIVEIADGRISPLLAVAGAVGLQTGYVPGTNPSGRAINRTGPVRGGSPP